MKTKIYFIQFFSTLSVLFIAGVITANAQALKVTPDANAGAIVDLTAFTRFWYKGSGDGLNLRTQNSLNVMSSTSDLIWLCLEQNQPNNPKIFGITSMSASIGWSECFTVRAKGNFQFARQAKAITKRKLQLQRR